MVNDDNPTTELNDSKLAHINNENIDNDNDHILTDDIITDKTLIEFIKENMLKEKVWNEEMRELLQSQIIYLNGDYCQKYDNRTTDWGTKLPKSKCNQ